MEWALYILPFHYSSLPFAFLPQKTQLSEERRQAQRTADAAVISAIKAHADSRLLRRYLKSRFQLWNSVLPHKLKF